MTVADEPDVDTSHQNPAVQQAAATASEAVSATADALNQATQDSARLGEASAERYTEAHSQAETLLDQTRSRLEQVGVPGMAASQGMVDQLKAGSDLLSKHVMAEYGQSQKALVEFNGKVVEAWRRNAEATIAYWQRLSGVTNWSDLVALNSAHLRQQIEAMTAQSRELADLAGRTARDGAQSLTKIGRSG